MKILLGSILSLTVILGFLAFDPESAEAALFSCDSVGTCQDTAFSLSSSEQTTFNCEEEGVCRNLEIVLLDIDQSLTINCTAESSCANLTVSVSPLAHSSTSSGTLTLNCHGEGACENAVVVVPSGAFLSLDCAEGNLNYGSGGCSGITIDTQSHRVSSTESDQFSEVQISCLDFACEFATLITQPEHTGYYDENGLVTPEAFLACAGPGCFDLVISSAKFCPLGFYYAGPEPTDTDFPLCLKASANDFSPAYQVSRLGTVLFPGLVTQLQSLAFTKGAISNN